MLRFDVGVPQSNFRIGSWQFRLHPRAQHFARTIRVFPDVQQNQVGDVLRRACQPVLNAEQIDAHILRRAGNELEQLRHRLQCRHLPLTA